MVMMKEWMLTISYSSPRLAGPLQELPRPPDPKPEAFSEACPDPAQINHDQDNCDGQYDDDGPIQVLDNHAYNKCGKGSQSLTTSTGTLLMAM